MGQVSLPHQDSKILAMKAFKKIWPVWFVNDFP